MGNKRFMRLKKVAASILAITLAVTMPCMSVAAATINANTYVVAGSENVQESLNKRDIRSLIIYFVSKNADYYRQNGLNPDFKYFNADNYIKSYKDVAELTGGDKSAALEHYLTYGAIEGRSSGTAFDPIVAIVAMPELALLTPDEIFNAWIQAKGKATTADYTLKVVPDENGGFIYITNMASASDGAYMPTGDSGFATNSSSGSDTPILNKKTFTFLLYLCGTNLESGEGQYQATNSLLKVLLGAYDEDNVNVLVLAGGTDSWKNNYLNELLGGRAEGEKNKSAIFAVNKAGVKQIVDGIIASRSDVNSVEDIAKWLSDANKWSDTYNLMNTLINANTLTMIEGSYGRNEMNDPATLLSLLEVAKTEGFKADHYGLSLWNHGGGSVEGVCFPDDDKYNGLTISEIKSALDTAGFGSTASEKPYKLGLLAFDACLMGGAEIAAYLNDCYDMMYGSEEVTYGDIDYFNVLNIANQKSGNDYLSYYLAIAILEDRLANYTGLKKWLATGALFENGAVNAPLSKLNDMAANLNALAATDSIDAQRIYRAIKYARVKSEQIGSNDTKDNSKDYVDMKNFLQMLKAELLKEGLLDKSAVLSKSIDEAILASDEMTYSNVFNYAGQKIFYNLKDSDDFWLNKDFWDKIKGMELSGANIYVPYYGVDNGTIAKSLKIYEDTYASTIGMSDYNTLIKNYSDEYINSEAEKERIRNLTAELISGYDANNEQVMGYSSLLQMSLEDSNTDAGKYLSIKIKDYESSDVEPSAYTSGDAFVDLVDTMNTMLVYITRRAEAICKEEGAGNVYVDVVVGSKTISYENLNGLQSSINIFTDYATDDVNMNVIKETDYTDRTNPIEQISYDFVTPSDMDGWNQMNDMIRAIIGEAKDPDNYMTVKGTAKVGDEYIVVYHLFERSTGNNYTYKGSTELDSTGSTYKVKDPIKNAEAITFYHQIVDKSTNKLVYAEEYKWEDATKNTMSIDKLKGAKEYDLSDGKQITINATPVKNVGSSTDNSYYFAISQSINKIDDDVFAGNNVVDDGYKDSPDIYDSLDKAMGVTTEPAAEGNPEDKAKPKSNENADNPADTESTSDNDESNSSDDLGILGDDGLDDSDSSGDDESGETDDAGDNGSDENPGGEEGSVDDGDSSENDGE